jgi:hypothetical protein
MPAHTSPSAFVYPKEAFDAAGLGCCEAGAYLCPHGLHIRAVANVWRFGAWPGALFRDVELVNLGSLGCTWMALRFDGRPTSRGGAVPAGLFAADPPSRT